MKTVYKIISGLLLSLIASLAIAGLVSLSNLVRPAEEPQIAKISKEHAQIKVTHKEGICHQYGKENKASKAFSVCK